MISTDAPGGAASTGTVRVSPVRSQSRWFGARGRPRVTSLRYTSAECSSRWMPPFGFGEDTAKLQAVAALAPGFLSSTAGGLPGIRRADSGASAAASTAVDVIRKTTRTPSVAVIVARQFTIHADRSPGLTQV